MSNDGQEEGMSRWSERNCRGTRPSARIVCTAGWRPPLPSGSSGQMRGTLVFRRHRKLNHGHASPGWVTAVPFHFDRVTPWPAVGSRSTPCPRRGMLSSDWDNQPPSWQNPSRLSALRAAGRTHAMLVSVIDLRALSQRFTARKRSQDSYRRKGNTS